RYGEADVRVDARSLLRAMRAMAVAPLPLDGDEPVERLADRRAEARLRKREAVAARVERDVEPRMIDGGRGDEIDRAAERARAVLELIGSPRDRSVNSRELV